MRVPPVHLGSLLGELVGAVCLVAAVPAAVWVGRRRSAESRARSEARAALEEVALGKARSARSSRPRCRVTTSRSSRASGRAEAVLHGAAIDSFERLAAMRPGR